MYCLSLRIRDLSAVSAIWSSNEFKFTFSSQITFVIVLAAVVQTLVSVIHRIKIYPMDSAIGFPNTYPLDSDLSGG